MLLLLSLWSCRHVPPAGPAAPVAYEDLVEDGSIAGFTVKGVYTDHRGVRRGASLVHGHTGFVLRLISQDTVPQAWMYVNTVPTDDRGAPHTQEHLLLGKGNIGRAVADAETFQLVESSAYTETHRTVYHFRTASGLDGFHGVFEQRLNALLNPDYTDIEIRREVYHFGVDAAPDGTLSLVEKGTVYNEMETSARTPGRLFWDVLEEDLYGPGHPEGLNAGGDPDPMRSLTPADIRAFHASTHALGNMGALLFLPPADLQETLGRLDGMLRRLQPEPTPAGRSWPTEATLPPAATTSDRAMRVVPYPKREGKGTVDVTMAWPPRGDRTLGEDTLLSLFFDALAGDASSNLHKALVDDETEERDTGARSVWAAQYEGNLGSPVMMGASDFPLETGDDVLAWVRERMLQELRTVSSWAPGDPALEDFDRRVRNDLVPRLRQSRMTLSAPPGFGTRGTGSGWHDYLVELDGEGGFERSLAMADAFAWVQQQLDREENVWAELIAREGWLVEEPLVYVKRPDPSLLDALDAARDARLAEETARLMAEAGTEDPQVALKGLLDVLDAETAQVEAGRVPTENRLVEGAPLDRDPTLRWERTSYAGVPAVVGHSDALTGARVALVFDLRRAPPEHLEVLAVFQELLTDVGLVVDGEVLDDDAVVERLKEEVRSVWASSSTNERTGRMELVLSAEGTDLRESVAALTWIGRFIDDAHWAPENLERMRTLTRATSERWLDWTPTGFVGALEHQGDGRMLRTTGPVAQLDVLRMAWRLRDAGADEDAVVAAIELLGAGGVTTLEHPLVDQARRDLERLVRDCPEGTADSDRAMLAGLIVTELRRDPTVVLDELRAVRDALFRRGSVRVEVSAGSILPELTAPIEALIQTLPEGASPEADVPPGTARERMRARGIEVQRGLMAWMDPELRTGEADLRVPLAPPTDLTEDTLIDLLALRTLGGGGARSMFMRTWGEGLAYSNGVGVSPHGERLTWSADRCPQVARTAAFAKSLVADTPVTPTLVEYALAEAFSSDAHLAPQSRLTSMARRLEDGRGPDVERAHRTALLALRDREDLVERVAARQQPAYAPLFPADGTWGEGSWAMVTGDEDQLAGWDAWLVENGLPPAARVHPRDFWVLDDFSLSASGAAELSP